MKNPILILAAVAITLAYAQTRPMYGGTDDKNTMTPKKEKSQTTGDAKAVSSRDKQQTQDLFYALPNDSK